MEKNKNYLPVAIMISILVVAYSAWLYADSYSKSIQPSSFRSFSVTGEGKSVALPDVAEFIFGVITQDGKDIAALQKENTEKANKAIELVKEKGVESKDIKTSSYNLEPRYQYSSCPREGGICPPPEIVGYAVSQSVSVKVRDFSKIGEIMQGVVAVGVNSVSQLTFKIDDPASVQNVARAEAISKAKAKAKLIAKAGGFSLGRLLSIEESGYPIPIYYSSKGLEMGTGGAVSFPPTIEPGSEEVTVNVVLRYEIK